MSERKFNGEAYCIWEMSVWAGLGITLLTVFVAWAATTAGGFPWWSWAIWFVLAPILLALPIEQYGESPIKWWWHRIGRKP